MEYSMESLAEKFAQHAIEAKEMNKELIKTFKKNFPDEELPDHFNDDFSLPAALSSICREILRLRDGL